VEKAGDIPFMPTVGSVTSNDPAQYGSPFDHAREHAEAGFYRVHLAKYATNVELTASTHAAMQRYTFPPTPQANVIVDVGRGVSGGSRGRRTTFYTALYHAQLHPNVFTDVDGRYLGFDGKPHTAAGRTQYANFSLWDTYKGENQLLATIQPNRYRQMLLSLLD